MVNNPDVYKANVREWFHVYNLCTYYEVFDRFMSCGAVPLAVGCSKPQIVGVMVDSDSQISLSRETKMNNWKSDEVPQPYSFEPTVPP